MIIIIKYSLYGRNNGFILKYKYQFRKPNYMIKNIKNNFTINDFNNVSNTSLWKDYNIKKDVVIFGKILKKENFQISARDIENLDDYLENVNRYLEWLGNECKEYLVNKFCEIVSSWDIKKEITPKEVEEIQWYENLKVYHTTIFTGLDNDKKKYISARISCSDIYRKDKIIEFNLDEKQIEMKYDEVRYYKLRQVSEDEEIVQNYLINKEPEEEGDLAFSEEDEDETKRSPICEVHNYQMELEEVDILYGLPIGPTVGYTEEREITFPNCDDYLLGGCCISDDNPKCKLKYICKICNEKREEWKKKHRS
jgi:hypothetical protein